MFTKTKVGERRQPLPVRVQLYRVARDRRVHARAARRQHRRLRHRRGSAPDTSTTFAGMFQPYQAHVFQISNSAPVRTPVPSATPSTAPPARRLPERQPRCELLPTTATATITDADCDCDGDSFSDAYCHGHARCVVGFAGEVEIRCSETRHHQSSQDFEGDQRWRGGGELYRDAD